MALSFKIHKVCNECGDGPLKDVDTVIGLCSECFKYKFSSRRSELDDNAPRFKFTKE